MSGSDHKTFHGESADYKRRLWLVILINAGMFGIEITGGHLAQSKALLADSLDFLADSMTYGLSLYVIGMGIRPRTMAALFKGFSLLGMGLWVFFSTAYAFFNKTLPDAQWMGEIGLLALLVNVASVLILATFKNGDANVRSVWLCSRNDAIGNVAVILAAVAVWLTASRWPDLIVATLMAGLFLTSAVQILRQALDEYYGMRAYEKRRNG